MEKYAILLGYFNKQRALVDELYEGIRQVDLTPYANRYLFALKTQQFYTAIEDLLKQVAKAFENHVEDLSAYHKELLIRLNTEIPNVRPALLTDDSLRFLDKVRKFRHFIRHAYSCELDPAQLAAIQRLVNARYPQLQQEIASFQRYVSELAGGE